MYITRAAASYKMKNGGGQQTWQHVSAVQALRAHFMNSLKGNKRAPKLATYK